MRINHNISALNTYRQMGVNQNAASGSMEKLSSGLRINRASDDAAGLSISEKMRGQIRGLDQASRNAQDGVSLIQTAEGALSETHDMLQRMRELVVQANNGTNTEDDRNKIQEEIKQLQTEVTKTAQRTEFNSQKLLDGTFGATVDTAAAGDITSKFDIIVNGAKVQDGYKLTTGVGGGSGKAEITSTAGLATANTDFAVQKTAAGTDDLGLNLEVDGHKIGDVALTTVQSKDYDDATVGTGGYDELATNLQTDINAAITQYNTTNNLTGDAAVKSVKVENIEGKMVITSGTDGKDSQSQIKVGTAGAGFDDVSAKLGITNATDDIDNSLTLVNTVSGDTQKVYIKDTADVKAGQTISFDKIGVDFKVKALITDVSNIKDAGAANTFDIDSGSKDLQIGANAAQQMSIQINNMTANALQIDTIDVSGANYSSTDFDAHIASLDNAIKTVSSERSNLGALQNRLDHTINNLNTSNENLTAAESRIRDVDMAKEMMQMTKENVKAQAAQAMLAQANQNPQQVLQLLR